MKKIIITLVSVASCLTAFSQDILFSQPNEAPIILNPANAGIPYDLRVNLNYREQWKSITEPYRTIAASVDGKVLSQGKTGSSIGAGLTLFNDKAGIGKLTTNQAMLNVSGKIMLGPNQTLSAGLSGGIIQRRIGGSELTWGNQYNGLIYDSNLPTGEVMNGEQFLNADFGAGVQWSFGRGASTLSSNDMFGAQIGGAVNHVNSPATGFYELADKRALHYTVHGTIAIGLKNTNLQISPQFLYKRQGPSQLIYFGSMFRYGLQSASKYTGNLQSKTISVGGFIRGSDAFVAIIQAEIGQFGAGISYDFNFSGLRNVSTGRGGFEISLKYYPLSSRKDNSLI